MRFTPAGGLWAEAFRVERRGVDLRAGLAGALASCAPLAIGVAANEPEIGVTACFGGLNAALAVPRGDLRERVGWGAGAALACCASVAVATAVQDSVAASVAAAFAVVGLAAYLRVLGPNGGLTGFVIGAIFVITNGIAAGSLDVGERVLWFGLGSLAAVVLMVAAYARSAAQPRRAAASVHLTRHALRLASLVAATTLGYKLLELEHGYWVPLTVLAVLQPDEHTSDVRALQRAAHAHGAAHGQRGRLPGRGGRHRARRLERPRDRAGRGRRRALGVVSPGPLDARRRSGPRPRPSTPASGSAGSGRRRARCRR